MNPTMMALRAGIHRGGIELRQTFTDAQDLWSYLFPNAVFLAVMLFSGTRRCQARVSPWGPRRCRAY